MAAALWLLIAAASAVAWVQLDGTPWAARLWALILLVPLPVMLILDGRRLRELDTLPRTQAYISSIVSLWVLAGITLVASYASGYQPADLGLVLAPTPRTAWFAAALTIAGVAVLFLFKYAGVRETSIVRDLLPASGRDRVLFTGVSVTAGVCEEIIFRGFLVHVLYSATGSLPIALVLSAGAFGVAHAYQQPAGALRATLLGLLLATPLVMDGSIVAAIAAHIAIDLLSGLWLARYLLD